MKELSMHILDIARNSVRGKAKNIKIQVKELEKENRFEFNIIDDGVGIPKKIFKDIKNPFITSRTMRKVGLGIPLLNDTCKLCNGELNIVTKDNEGTKVNAVMEYNSIDRPPLGDITSTIVGLISSNGNINIRYEHIYNDNSFDLSSEDIKNVLGEVPLTDFRVIKWMKDYINENLDEIH